MRVARLRVDLVPPPQADEPPPGDVLEVVEVGREEEDGDDEDQDAVRRRARVSWGFGLGRLFLSSQCPFEAEFLRARGTKPNQESERQGGERKEGRTLQIPGEQQPE